MVGHLSPGLWSACFGASLIDMLFYDLGNHRRIVGSKYGHVHKESGAGHIYSGRNFLAKMLLDESDREWLFLVDSDMGFAPDTVDRLVASADRKSRPVMGGLAFAQKSAGNGPMFARRYRATPTLYQMGETNTEVGFLPMFDYPRGEVVEVAATGAACLLIHRTALEKVRERHGDHWFHHIAKPKGTGDFGEDMSFCLRLATCDIPIHVDTGVRTTHDKGGVFYDEDTYDLQQAMRALALEPDPL